MTVPAGHDETGIWTFLGLGCNPTPRETSLGVGERGVEKGCAMPVDVAAGVPSVRGEVVWAEAGGANNGRPDVIDRDEVTLDGRRVETLRIQLRQIMAVVL